MKAINEPNFAAFIGVDWADQKHDVCCQLASGGEAVHTVISSRPESVHAWVKSLHEQFNGQPVAVATEQSKGSLISILLSYEWVSVFITNPSTVAKYRHAFTHSRAKNDVRDAHIILELLTVHRDKLRQLEPDEAAIRALSALVHQRRKMVQERVNLTNRIVAQLKGYFPQALDLFADRDTEIFCDFLEKWPSLVAAKRARSTSLLRFFNQHNARNAATNQTRIALIQSSTPVSTDQALNLTSELFIRCWIPQLRGLIESINVLDSSIDQLYQRFEETAIFDSLPGAGAKLAPRLLVAFGTQRNRFESAAELQKYAGIAPVTEASGKQHWVHWRYNCPTFLRQTFVEWAGQSVRFSRWAKAYYQQQLARGKTHHVALRSLAFKWIRVVFACWKTNTPDRFLLLQNLHSLHPCRLRKSLHRDAKITRIRISEFDLKTMV